MSTTRGVTTERSTDSSRPIKLKSTLPIALVVTSNIAAGIYGFDSPFDALEHSVIKTHTTGNMLKYLSLGDDEFPVTVPIILIVCNEGVDDAATKTNIIDGINTIKRAASTVNLASEKGSMIGFKPDIIAVADYAIEDMDVSNALIVACEATKARTFIDLGADSNGDAITKRDLFGSDRVTVAKTSLGKWNTLESKTDFYDSGVVLAWLRCYVDASKSTGYAKSISNKTLPFSSVKEPSTFVAGAQDDTDPLTENQITSFIVYSGLRVWNYKTTSIDAIWQNAVRTRIVDLAADAVLKGIFFAIDEGLKELGEAKKSIRGMMDALVGDDILLGASVYLDLDRTTLERITAGEFYLVADFTDTPIPELICVRFNRTDRFLPLVYERIAAV